MGNGCGAENGPGRCLSCSTPRPHDNNKIKMTTNSPIQINTNSIKQPAYVSSSSSSSSEEAVPRAPSVEKSVPQKSTFYVDVQKWEWGVGGREEVRMEVRRREVGRRGVTMEERGSDRCDWGYD